MLWTDRDEASARNNLRQTLTALRKVVPDHLLVDGDQVGITGPYTIDTKPIRPEGYRGDFLAGLDVPDAQLFEEWAQRVRSAHAMVAISVFETAANRALEEGDIAAGLIFGHRILDLEPWNEIGHRLVMRLLAADDRVPEAIDQYDRCAGILRDELGVEPSAETQALLRRDRSGGPTGETETPRPRLSRSPPHYFSAGSRSWTSSPTPSATAAPGCLDRRAGWYRQNKAGRGGGGPDP